MLANDADLVEINPLAIVRGGPGGAEEQLVCLDAKITLDDSALFRHPDHEALRDPDEEAPADAEARRHDISFIHLDGTIGCMVNGAGPRDDDDGPRQARRRRAGQLPRHRRRREGRAGRGRDAPDPRRAARSRRSS